MKKAREEAGSMACFMRRRLEYHGEKYTNAIIGCAIDIVRGAIIDFDEITLVWYGGRFICGTDTYQPKAYTFTVRFDSSITKFMDGDANCDIAFAALNPTDEWSKEISEGLIEYRMNAWRTLDKAVICGPNGHIDYSDTHVMIPHHVAPWFYKNIIRVQSLFGCRARMPKWVGSFMRQYEKMYAQMEREKIERKLDAEAEQRMARQTNSVLRGIKQSEREERSRIRHEAWVAKGCPGDNRPKYKKHEVTA